MLFLNSPTHFLTFSCNTGANCPRAAKQGAQQRWARSCAHPNINRRLLSKADPKTVTERGPGNGTSTLQNE